ncbi:MAG: PEP-CTERM sorting domain-containing protein [Verrucomicrobiae bacterium]|nr:PEP-CTERM sorting domain-containing protein [Verrucomicrobiae bacterium]
MAKWTESAKAEWKAYGQRLRNQLNGSEADSAEVEEDIKRHVDEEMHATGLTVVDAEQLRSILTRIGELETPQETEAGNSAKTSGPSNKKQKSETFAQFRFGLLVLTSVVWPLIVLVIEVVTRMCTALVFDPMPSIWHAFVLFGIPVGNLLALLRLKNTSATQPHWVSLLVSFNVGVSLVYTLFFMPLLPIGVLGIVIWGFGLLPLAPLAACLSGFVIWSKCSDRLESSKLKYRLFWLGFTGAIALLLVLEAPNFLTRTGLRWADSEETVTRARGISWLRNYGNEETILKACYERPRRVFDVSSWLTDSSDAVTQDDARKIFYQVTGRPFNSVQPPSMYTREGRWNMLDEEFTWEFDTALGITSVAGRVRGLRMISSRMDSRIETASALAYTEWTMEFENQASMAREVRTQIKLPSGGVVSRLTLWVGGEEREAAFASRAQTRKAYQKIAVERRRDPVLVTTSGPDQILMQCFPVPADGGKMKIRFGITSPLDMLDLQNGRVRLPAMVERNFNLKDGLKHSVWLESRSELEGDESFFRQGSLKDGDFTLQGKLLDDELLAVESSIQVMRPEAVTQVWTEAQEKDHVVVQRLIEQQAQPLKSTVVVIDGSVSMASCFDEIHGSLMTLESLSQVRVVVASDLPAFQDESGDPVVFNLNEATEQLSTTQPVGGQDNLLALATAWDVAGEIGASTIWWIHGPQPTLLEDMAPMLQRMERSRGDVQLISYAMVNGPNRIMEAFDGLNASVVPKYAKLGATMKKWVSAHAEGYKNYEFERSQQKSAPSLVLSEENKVSRHIERLWAAHEVDALSASKRVSEAIRLASKQQLVTPVTGAVVLETVEQYKEMGLTPVPVDTVPGIPEPSTMVLMLLGILVCLGRLKIISLRRSNDLAGNMNHPVR